MKNNIYRVFTVMIFIIILLSQNFVYAESDLSVDADAALIIETNTGKIIYEKNAEKRIYPASLTKILTAIVVLENSKLDEVATVSKTALENIPASYVVAPLYVGEKITVEELMYALLLESANDAAYVLAEHVGNTIQGFADMMNKKAKEIGCKDTHFINPNGIHDDNHYTTAYDLYLMSRYAMQNQTFAKIVKTYKFTLSSTNKYSKKDRVMTNRNYFVNPNSKFYNKNAKGIKTGTTSQAGNCVITDVAKDGLEFITVVLGAETYNSRFSETEKMIDYSFTNYTLTDLHKKGEIIKKIEVKNATKDTKDLELVISNDITTMNNVKIRVEDIEPEITLNDDIKAPISEGEVLGTIKYTVDGLEYTAELLAKNDVEKKTYYFEILVGSGAVLVILCVCIIIKKKKKTK